MFVENSTDGSLVFPALHFSDVNTRLRVEDNGAESRRIAWLLVVPSTHAVQCSMSVATTSLLLVKVSHMEIDIQTKTVTSIEVSSSGSVQSGSL